MQQIVIQRSGPALSAAVLEDGRLAEYFLRRGDADILCGDIYRGVVEKVLPGMQAAFVDIGRARNAYLALEDLALDADLRRGGLNISDVLKAGQSVVVQVTREAAQPKGPKVTTELSLQGRMLVLLSGAPHVAVSKKISGERRRQLAAWCEPLLEGANFGLIVRTAAETAARPELEAEFRWLAQCWEELSARIAATSKPGLIRADASLALEVVRTYGSQERLEGIYVDDAALWEQLRHQLFPRALAYKLRLREEDLAERFGLGGALRGVHSRRVRLPSGGELVFDRTEALRVIDVNTGRYTGRRDFAETVRRINLEAVREIAWQLRLRNLSGMILIDFINMELPEDRAAVLEALREAVAGDPVRTSVLGWTQLGLMELTRERQHAPLEELLEEPCPRCGGKGYVPRGDPG